MRSAIAGVAIAFAAATSSASAGVIFGTDQSLGGGYRWDAANRSFAGFERSLQGGLRFSVQGGSFQAFRDLFTWNALPTVAEFSTAVNQAFSAWTAVDPVSGLGTTLSFVDDIANTAVFGTNFFGGVDIAGAEIDLFGMDAGDAGQRGVSFFSSTVNDNVTLTSGVSGYGGAQGGGAIIGADIKINSNTGAQYTLDSFRRLLTHEIGHALGLGDAEDFFGNGFIDDNYNGSSDTTAVATLNNSWALLVNPLNPKNSVGLTQFAPGTIANGVPGLDTVGVNILMESEGLGIGASNPQSSLVPLTNDDFGTRQFLYPVFASEAVPEPSSLAFAAVAAAGALGWRKRRGRSADR
jgi:hypothetical protein